MEKKFMFIRGEQNVEDRWILRQVNRLSTFLEQRFNIFKFYLYKNIFIYPFIS